MGQAFDEDGHVLGEAFGHTKADVFEKLNAAHRDAAEIRIKSLTDKVTAVEAAQRASDDLPAVQMPRYKSHKDVWALKIASVHRLTEHDAEGRDILMGAELMFVDPAYLPRTVSPAYVMKHDPRPNTYYVVYADGYESCSPAKAFEEGYARI